MLGDLNGGAGDRVRLDITDTFGVPGTKIMERLWLNYVLCVGNIYFKHKSYIKCTRAEETEAEWR